MNLSKLAILRSAQGLHDLANLLAYEPKKLSYVIYKMPNRYTQFTIPKSSGGTRSIAAPREELKALQVKVSQLLQQCIHNMNADLKITTSLSHGFTKGHSIMTNADLHRKKRYVFNIDIENFFGSIHRGRVFGFLTKNRSFSLNPKVARALAQIACHDNALPQGAPSSPVFSNLIGHLIDVRLVELAEKLGCSYSRYADDITFSTNKKNFPKEIAFVSPSNEWVASPTLIKIVSKCGFALNENKTRMQYQESRQSVTGLTVNRKINSPAVYRHQVRAMAHSLFNTGSFSVPDKDPKSKAKIPGTINQLGGMLSYIYMVNTYNRSKIVENSAIRDEDINLSSMENVHADFMFYKSFYGNSKITILCEGKTDNIYLQCAIKSLAKKYTILAKLDADGKAVLDVNFFKYTKLTHRLLNLYGGTGDIGELIKRYVSCCGKYKNHPFKHPTIVVVDNDEGSQKIFTALKVVTGNRYMVGTGKSQALDKSLDFYYVAQNLYVVFTPLKASGEDTMMEDFFTPETLNTIVDGQRFSVVQKVPGQPGYSKHTFSQNVVKANQKTINFLGFSPVLDRIQKAAKHFYSIP